MTAQPIRPKPHQVEALTALMTSLSVHDRVILAMACGTGKTYIGRWHAQASEATRVLVLLPSLGLVAQTLREWRRANHGSSWSFDAVVVCSDPSTVDGSAERLEDDLDIDSGIWNEVSAEVTTEASRVSRFLARPPERPQVVFSTYHSSPVVAEAQRQTSEPFDLVICDEAHRLAGNTGTRFATVLDARKIVARRRVFMTATPRISTAEGVVSMSDPRLFGPLAHKVSFREAIEAGLLVDYQVSVIARPQRDDASKLEILAGTVAQACDQLGLRRLLTFHGRVHKARAFAEGLSELTSAAGSQLTARPVTSGMPAGERSAALTWLGEPGSSQVRVLSSARCLSEGVDVPAVDGVVFADQRKSPIDIIQAIGRVLRPGPGKSVGTIILPVVVKPGVDEDTELAVSDFGTVWSVLRALRAHDERFEDELAQLQRVRVRGDQKRSTSGRLSFDLDPSLDFAALNLRDIELRLLDEVGSRWDRNYAVLEEWATHHDGALLPRSAKAEHNGTQILLGEWAEQQRIARRRGLLSAEHAHRLQQIPGWAWDKAESRWQSTFQLLLDHVAEHGTVAENPSGESRFRGIKDAETPRRDLGVWMATQRQAYRLGTLAEDRAALLQDLPGWRWDAGLPQVDVEMIEALRVFVEFEKHAEVPDDHREDGLRLGAWCWSIRRRHWTGNLAPALFDELRAATPSKYRVGHFDWAKGDTQWRIGYFGLKQYAAREGTATPACRVIEQLPDTTVAIGQWAALQRLSYRRGELDDWRTQLLEALPGWRWEVELQRVEASEPKQLSPGKKHGTPGAYGRPNNCRCSQCLAWRRESDRARLAKQRVTLNDPVPADTARERLAQLEGAGITRGVLACQAAVPLGVIRKVLGGTRVLERDHRDRLLQITLQACQEESSRLGSRGRSTSHGSERVDPGPTWVLLDDLAARGFGIGWVSRELGYVGGLQLRRDRQLQQRIHDAVADLHTRVGVLAMPQMPRNARRPTLRALLAAAQPELDSESRRAS